MASGKLNSIGIIVQSALHGNRMTLSIITPCMAVYLPLDGSDFAPNIIMLNEERQRFWEAWTVLYIHPPQLNTGPGI